MANVSLARLASILVFIGGIIMIVLGVIAFAGFSTMMFFESPLGHFFSSLSALLGIVLGIIAIFGRSHVKELVWAIVLVIVGFIGGGIGGLLVILGGILGLLSKYI